MWIRDELFLLYLYLLFDNWNSKKNAKKKTFKDWTSGVCVVIIQQKNIETIRLSYRCYCQNEKSYSIHQYWNESIIGRSCWITYIIESIILFKYLCSFSVSSCSLFLYLSVSLFFLLLCFCVFVLYPPQKSSIVMLPWKMVTCVRFCVIHNSILVLYSLCVCVCDSFYYISLVKLFC